MRRYTVTVTERVGVSGSTSTRLTLRGVHERTNIHLS